jgi:hypothetical protein
MNKTRTGSGAIILKAMCLALALITGSSIVATGMMAAAACGMKCCCQSVASDMQHEAQGQVRSSMGCCPGIALNACDLEAAQPYRLPEIIPASCCGTHQVTFGPTVILYDYFSDGRNASGNFTFQPFDQMFTSPPLYLQNHVYLI